MKDAKTRLEQEIRDSKMSRRRWYRKIYLKSDHWKFLKAALFKKKPKQCKKCKSCLRIDVHHKEYKYIYDVTIDDLEILCRKCHRKEHKQIDKKKVKPARKERQYRNPKRIIKNLMKELEKERSKEVAIQELIDNNNIQ